MPGRSLPSDVIIYSYAWHQVDALTTGVVFVLDGDSTLDQGDRESDRGFYLIHCATLSVAGQGQAV